MVEPSKFSGTSKVIRHLAWVTDPHFNYAPLAAWEEFLSQLAEARVDGLLLTGDISESSDVDWHLSRLADATGLPIWFVLGNHDFYHASIASVRERITNLSRERSNLYYLTGTDPALDFTGVSSSDWALSGDDGWADARVGDYFRSPVRMMDYELIHDFVDLNAEARLTKIQAEGMSSAVRLRRQLEQARLHARQQLVLTHVPPFRESCWYDGQHSDDAWAPYFTCTAVGWTLRRFCQRYPEQRVLVLCGHTHGSGMSRIAHNLSVWTGAAVEGRPRMNAILELDSFPVVDYDWSYTDGFRAESDPSINSSNSTRDLKGGA